MSKLAYTQKCLSRARVSLFRQKQVGTVNKISPTSTACAWPSFCNRANALPPVAKQFIMSQVQALSVSRFGMRWTQQDKLLALGLYYKSPSAYRFMQHTFRLPTERTLRNYITGFDVTTGFDTDFMAALQKRVEALNDAERNVVVTFDGMSLRSALKYFEHDDRIVGFEDLASFGGVSVNVAKHALQFMVRGISSRWKQPVGHFFIGASVNSEILKSMIVSLITKLEAIGLHVAAVVCDQEASHRVCLNALGVTNEAPFFTSTSGNVVYVLNDPPHLIKNVRNNLLRYDFLIDDAVVSFEHIATLFELEQANVLRFVPKLTKGHIEMNNFKKMNVKLATQVLSHSVASGIRAYIALNQMSSDANPTADFVERINRLFDIMNSNNPKVNNKWKKPLTSETVEQLQELKNAAQWIEKWHFRSKKKPSVVKVTLPFKSGFVMTLNALHDVCCSLLCHYNFRFILTSRFNQDIVENWFSCIRGKGRNNDSRTTVEYEAASKNVTVNWMLKPPTKGANCELDCDSFIGLMKDLDSSRKLAEVRTPDSCSPSVTDLSDSFEPDPSDDIDVSVDWCQLCALNDVDSNVVCYIAGYICAKINKKISCPDCHTAYVHSKETWKTLHATHTVLVQTRQFDWAKYGLTVPSPALYELCCAIERVVQTNMEGVMAGPGVMGSLKDIFMQSVDRESYEINCCCKVHQTYWLNAAVTLFLRVRIHHFVKVRNRELKQLAAKQKEKHAHAAVSKPSRKLKKVKHH